MSSEPGTAPQGRTEGVSAWQTLMRPPDEFAGIRTAAKVRQAGQMRRVEKNLHIANRLDEAIRGRKTYEEVRELVRKSGAVCTIRKKQTVGAPLSEDDLRDINLSYRNQANLEMYTSTNMRKREENRRHPEVVEVIEHFWKIMPKTENGNVNKSIYKWMSRKLFFTFVPKATDQEFERTVYEDWKNDACYSHLMNHRAFVNAIFSLADVWCETVDPLEYRDFLDRCRKIVQAPPEYKGRRDEERDDRGAATVQDRHRSGAPTPLNDSRRESLARISDDSDKSLPTGTPPPMEGDSMEALRIGGEYLEDEMLQLASIEAYKVLSTVSDLQSNLTEEAEDAISQAVRDLQDRRYECFLDDKDESFTFEADLMQAARDQVAQREVRRATIANEQALVAKQPFQDPSQLDKWRAKRVDRQQAFEECLVGHMNLIREALLTDVSRFKAARIRVSQLQKHLCADLKNKLEPGFLVPRAQYDTMVKESIRSCDSQCENDDDAFSEFIFLTRVLQLFQREGDRILRRTPLQAIYEEFFSSTDPDIADVSKKPKFGNSRWKRGTEWLWEVFRNRGEIVDEIIEAAFDNVKRLTVKSTKALHGLHRVEMELETSEIEMLVKDPFISPKDKLGSLNVLQEKKQQSLAFRSEQSAQLQKRAQQWEGLLQAAQAQSRERLEAEKKLVAGLDEVKSIEEAFQALRPLLNLYSEQAFTGSRDAMEETMAPNAVPPSPKSASLRGEALPAEITGPVELLHYLTEQSAQCLTRWLTNFGVAVHGIFAEKRTTFLELEEEHVRRLGASYERAIITSGLDLVARLKDMLCDAKQTKDFTEAQISEMQEMIAQEPYLQQLLKTIQAAKAFREDALHRITKLECDRAKQRSQRYVGVLGAQNTALLKLNELHTARIQHERQLIARFTDEWSDVEKQAKIAGALAAERRQKEAERMLREQQLAEERRKAAEVERLRRLAEDEKERKAADAAKKKREQDILATRKKQLEERERREKERQKADEEEKKRWRQEFAEEQKRQKKEAEERRQLELQRVRNATTAKKAPPRNQPQGKTETTPEAPAIVLSEPKEPQEGTARKLVRRKSALAPTYKPTEMDSKTQNAMLNTKKIKKAGAPSARIKEAIEAEVKAFGLLNSASLAINLESFAGRRTDYFVERASNAAIYAMECTRLRAPIVPAISTLLSNDELNFTMTNLDVSGKPCNLLTLLDVISLNPIQHFEARKVKGFDKDVCKKLCQALLNHQFIQVLDLRNNDLGAHGGQSLLALVESNPRIVRIKLQGCNVPGDIEVEINKRCDTHRFCNTIGRAEYQYIKSVFDEMDRDHSGEVDLAELRAYNQTHASLIGMRSTIFEASSSPVASPSGSIEQSMQDRQTQRVETVRDVLLQLDSEGTGSFTLIQLLCRIYPTWPQEEIEGLVARYSDDSSDGASLQEMKQFIETFGSNGTLTLHQLAKGLGEADPESLRPAFQECDLDGDGVLSIDEFMSFVGA